MITAKRIIVFSSKSITGGPEVLHQLVDALRTLGHEAYISYYPFDEPFECHQVYRKYNAPQIDFVDASDVFYVVPEAATWILRRISHSNAAVWWLSVDNYLAAKHQSWFRDFYKRYTSLLSRRLPIWRLRKYKHFVQSKYAEDFLAKRGISSMPLSDYLNAEHLQQRDLRQSRKNIVVYNPKKGQKQTHKLRQIYAYIEFVPIENMTPRQVAELLASAKVYIDFGHHPGKDRFPREAAMAGCCVITGRCGSASYFEDVAIPDGYKLDDKSDSYVKDFGGVINSIFSNYTHHACQFEEYRQRILKEPTEFLAQIEAIFGSCS